MMFNPLDKNFPYVGLFSYAFILGAVYILKTKKEAFSIIWWLAMASCLLFWPIKLSPYIPAFIPWVRTLEPLTVPSIITIACSFTAVSGKIPKIISSVVIVLLIILSLVTNYLIATYINNWIAPTKEAFLKLKAEDPKVIYTDYLLEDRHPFANLIHYWNKFKPGLTVRVFTEENLSKAKDGYVFINWQYVQQNIDESGGEYKPPLQIYNPPHNWEKIYERNIPARLSLRGFFKNKIAADVKNYKIQVFKINP